MIHAEVLLARILLLSSMLGLVSTSATFAAQTTPLIRGDFYTFDIPSQQLEVSLTVFGVVANQQVLFSEEVVKGKTSSAVVGFYTVSEALEKMLARTSLTYEVTESNVILIRVKQKTTLQNQQDNNRLTKVEAPLSSIQTVHQNQNKKAVSDNYASVAIEEVIVTAAYREQSAQDVAATLQVFEGEKLEQLGAEGFRDYLLTVPGASFRDNGSGAKRVALRGVSNISATDFAAVSSMSTIGVYLNNVPIQGTSLIPDLGLFDLERVEVLKGPQGTLYGDGAMGGAVKMIYTPPNTKMIEGKMAAKLSGTKGGGFNFRTDGVINIPFVRDRVALRIVGSYRNDDGFIDNVLRGKENANDAEDYTIRGMLYAQLTEDFSADILLLRDEQNIDEFTQITRDLGDLELESAENRFTDYTIDLYALTLKYNFPFAELTSVTSRYDRSRNQVDHFSGLAQGYFNKFGKVTQDPYVLKEGLDTITQELRLVSQGDKRLDWIGGVFYRNRIRDSNFFSFIAPEELPDVNAGLAAALFPVLPADGRYVAQIIKDNFQQWAVYAEANFELIEHLELTAGLRWFDERVDNFTKPTGFSVVSFATGPPFFADTGDSGFIPKVGLSYKIGDRYLLYALASRGFRSSTINTNVTMGLGEIAANADTLWNFEVGGKTIWSNGRLTLNGALFFIDWSEIQILLSDFSPLFMTDLGFLSNAGDAEIRGFEFAFAAMPTKALSFGMTLGYTYSEMVRVSADAIKGVTLPNTPEWTVSVYGQCNFPVLDLGEGHIHFNMQYMDEHATQVITTTFPGGAFVDSYVIGNFRVGLKTEKWGIDLFIDNLWNERAQLGRGLAGFGSLLDADRFTIHQPRTLGVLIRRSFF